MQPPTTPPRDGLTQAQVVNLIQGVNALIVGWGAELIDMNLNPIEDFATEVQGGSVKRNSYANLHASSELTTTRLLDQGNDMFRPYITISNGAITARFNLGAYFAATARHEFDEIPHRYTVTGHDILLGLADGVGDSYAVTAGTGYLAAIEAILLARGYTQYFIDQSATAVVLPTARVWPMSDQVTWLSIVNDLIASIGYQGIWSDWNGALQVRPYEQPLGRSVEWHYNNADDSIAIIAPQKSIEDDLFDAPNRWVAFRSNMATDVTPVEGAGVYTFVNQLVGKSSVDRRGRVISKVFSVDAADQASLVAQASRTIDADMTSSSKLTLSTAPNPLHWHFDRLLLTDPGMGRLDVMATEWTLPLTGQDMTHSWTSLS